MVLFWNIPPLRTVTPVRLKGCMKVKAPPHCQSSDNEQRSDFRQGHSLARPAP